MDFSALSDGMKRLSAIVVFLSVTLVAPTLFVGMSSTALAAGTLTVENPLPRQWGEYLKVVTGFSYLIKWTPGNAGASVKIELLRLNKHYKWISKKTRNDGEYIWKIPTSVANGSKYKIRITSSKNSSISDKSNDLITILRASSWWKGDFSTFPSISLGIEDDGAGNWGAFRVDGCNPHNRWHVGVVGRGHPRRAGAHSFRFDNRVGEKNWCTYYLAEYAERTELSTRDVSFDDKAGVNRWYAWSVYHQDFTFVNGASVTHGQFKQQNDQGGCGDHHSGNDSPCILMFKLDKDRGMYVNSDTMNKDLGVIIPKSQISNKWNDILLHAKWSTGADGITQIWVNGKLKINKRGPNMNREFNS
jgi:hypothetical protein